MPSRFEQEMQKLERSALGAPSHFQNYDIPNDDITKLYTKQLLIRLADVRAALGRDDNPTLLTYFKTIKAELANRPHVPNKKEARTIRQQHAKRRKS